MAGTVWLGILSELHEARETWTAAGACFGDAAHRAVPEASPETRRLLLRVRRDAFNGRVVDPTRVATLERAVEREELGDGLASATRRFGTANRRLGDALERGRAAFAREERAQRDALDALSWSDPIRRGLALASREALTAAERAAARRVAPRKRRKIRETQLRYLSRCVLKTSPFSTLTPIGLGATTRDDATGLRRFPTVGERSLLRLRRYALNQVRDRVLLDPAVGRRARVELNPGLAREVTGKVRFLRPGRWGAAGVYEVASLVAAEFPSGALDALERCLADGPMALEELAAALDAPLATLEELVRLGLLTRHLPWSVETARLEGPMAAWLDDLGREAAARSLERIVEWESGFDTSSRPLQVLERLADERQRLAEAVGLGGEADGSEVEDFHEDVIRLGAGPGGVVAQLAADEADALLAVGRHLVMICGVFHPRHELHLALARHVLEAPGESMGLLQAFEIFGEPFTRYLTALRHGDRPAEALGLSGVETRDLEHHRRRARRFLDGALEPCGDDALRLPPDRLAEFLSTLPADLRSPLAATLLIQPAPSVGGWVLGGLGEGTGRWGSRFTQVWPPEIRARYLEHLRRRSHLPGDGGELITVWSVRGDNLNLHHAQTERVLELPEERSGLARERCLQLSDLRLRVTAGGALRLTDPQGRRLQPIHLGLNDFDRLPTILKFLVWLGPGDLRPAWPTRRARAVGEGEARVVPRLFCGPLLLARRSWSVPLQRVRNLVDATETVEGVLELDRWRRAVGLPRRVFWAEPVKDSEERTRPQFLDLASPVFLDLLRSALAGFSRPSVIFVEAVPDVTDWPDGDRRVLELCLDGLAFTPPGPRLGDAFEVGAPPRVAAAASIYRESP